MSAPNYCVVVLVIYCGCILLFPEVATADDCPNGLTLLGRMYGSSASGSGDEFKSDQTIGFTNVRWDTQYHETSVVTHSAQADSNLSAANLPNGFWISASGSDTLPKRWAVLRPYDGGDILRLIDPYHHNYQFVLGLYADTGEYGPLAPQGGANVNVVVCYKKPVPRPIKLHKS